MFLRLYVIRKPVGPLPNSSRHTVSHVYLLKIAIHTLTDTSRKHETRSLQFPNAHHPKNDMHYPTIDNVNNTHTLATQTHTIYITMHNVRVFFFVLACHQQQGTRHTTPKAAHHNQQYPACITLTRYHHNLQKQTTTRCLEARPAQARISSSCSHGQLCSIPRQLFGAQHHT